MDRRLDPLVAIVGAWALALGACGGSSAGAESTGPGSGAGPEALSQRGRPESLGSCETLSEGKALVELRCGETQLVEFRSDDGEEAGMQALQAILEARFGALSASSFSTQHEGANLQLSRLRGGGTHELRGVAMVVPVERGLRGLVCYRKGADVDEEFCRAVFAAALGARGLEHLGAVPAQSLLDPDVALPEGCQQVHARKVVCSTGELSWSAADGRDPVELREETAARLQSMADAEEVGVSRSEGPCRLRGQSASCLELQISDEASKEFMSFVMAIEEESETMVVCSFPAAIAFPLPAPCHLVIEK